MTDAQVFSAKETRLANYRMDICYDGQNYYGWQRHKNKPTIQGALEDAVTQCFGLRCNVEGSGRTDRGTHALGQVATINLPENINEKDALICLNNVLNNTTDQNIEIKNLSKVPADFHARTSAIGKCYHYKIWNDPDLPEKMKGKVWYIPEKLSVPLMKDACPLFVGMMDYASFAKVPNYKRASTVKTVYALDLWQENSFLCFSIIADGFLYKMVRNIVRILVKVGEKRTKIKDLPRIIAAKNRSASPGTAPASGLYLNEVFYDKNNMDSAIKKTQKIKD